MVGPGPRQGLAKTMRRKQDTLPDKSFISHACRVLAIVMLVGCRLHVRHGRALLAPRRGAVQCGNALPRRSAGTVGAVDVTRRTPFSMMSCAGATLTPSVA